MLIRIKSILKSNPLFKDKNLLILSIIETWILGTMIYLHICDIPTYLWFVIIFCVLLLILGGISYKKIDEFSINIIKNNKKNGLGIFFICFVIIIIGQIVYWITYYPGGFNLDALGQWDQIHGKQQLNNWHPVLTTFLYWILIHFNDNLAFCIFVQLVAFALSVSCLLREIYKNGINKWFIIITSIVIAIDPAIGTDNVCLIKDVLFSIVIVWIWFMAYKIYLSNGKWIIKLSNKIFFAFAVTALSLIRHNAIFLTLPLIIAGILIYRTYYKHFTQAIVISSVILIFVEGVMFQALKVEQHSNMVGEMVGVPMSVMANAYVNDYENTPENVKKFMGKIASHNEWEELYITGEWDSCKWNFGGTELLKDNNLMEIIKLAYETSISCPQTSYESIRENTRVVWQIVGSSYWSPWVYIEENEYGIEEAKVRLFGDIEYIVEQSENNLLGSMLFWNIGFKILVLLLLNWFACIKRKYDSMFFIIPIIVYNLLTMCLLSGPSFRYFYFNSVLFFPVIGIVLGMCSKEEKIMDMNTEEI